MYGKLENGVLTRCNLPLKNAEEDIFTNDSSVYLEYGYKPVIFTDPPVTEEGYYAVSHFEERDDCITTVWEVFENNEATENDYISALEELGVNTGEEPEE